MTWSGIVENLVSDVIFIALAILASWIWFFFSHRRKLQSFFHTLNTKKLIIYLSDLNVLPFGTIGSLGKKLSYQGHAVAYGEMQAAGQLKSLFSFIIPKLAETFQSIGTMFLSDAMVETIISPLEKKDVDSQSSFIALGSAAYNLAAAYIEDFDKGIARFQFGSMRLAQLETENPHNPTIVFSDLDPRTYPGTLAVRQQDPSTNISGSPAQPGTIDFPADEGNSIRGSGYLHPSDVSRFSLYSELIHNTLVQSL